MKKKYVPPTDRTEYFYRKTYFILDDEIYVELAALASESYKIVGSKEVMGCEVLLSDSKELKLASIPQNFQETLSQQKVIKENYQLTEKQFELLKEQYKENLLDVNQELLN